MPAIDEKCFIETNPKYGEGIAIDTYQNEISLVAARKAEDTGEIFMQWVYPLRKVDDKAVPSEKMLPWMFRLGSREQALTILVKLAGILGVKLVPSDGEPKPHGTPKPQGFGHSPSGADKDDGDLPF